MDNNSPRKKNIFDELRPYLEPKAEKVNLTADDYRRLSEWHEKRSSAYVKIIGELLGGMSAILSYLEQDNVEIQKLINVMDKIVTDAHTGFDEVRNISIEK